MSEPIHIEAPEGPTLPRALESCEKGALWLVALHLVRILNTTGYGEIRLVIHQGQIDRVESLERDKRIPKL